MICRTMTIINRLGMHARAAAMMVRTTSNFKAEVLVEKNGRQIDGKSIMDLMTLAAAQGTEIKVVTDGEDEAELMRVLEELVNNRFGEEE